MKEKFLLDKETESEKSTIESINQYSGEKEFQHYTDDLELTSEDFDKKILDIGAGNAKFAKWAKEHNISFRIYSIDRKKCMEEKTKAIRADAKTLPFKDESFDLVISNCAIPNTLNPDIKTVRNSFEEALRVVKHGGEIRFGTVLKGEVADYQIKLKRMVNLILDELRSQPDKFEVEEKPHFPFEIFQTDNYGKRRLYAKVYLITIRKLAL